MKIFIGADHCGLALKNALIAAHPSIAWIDVGTTTAERTDYPLFAKPVAQAVSQGLGRGVLICGSGVGMSIAANRYHGVYAGLCHDREQVVKARQHDDINILVLAGNILSDTAASAMLEAFLETPCLGGRYSERLCMIDQK